MDDALTGRENLVLIGRLLELSRGRGPAARPASCWNASIWNRPPAGLGTAPTRVACAAGLTWRPASSAGRRVLFLDEPTTGLDPRARGEVCGPGAGPGRRGATVLLTTQYLDEADRLAAEVAVHRRRPGDRTGTPAAPEGTSVGGQTSMSGRPSAPSVDPVAAIMARGDRRDPTQGRRRWQGVGAGGRPAAPAASALAAAAGSTGPASPSPRLGLRLASTGRGVPGADHRREEPEEDDESTTRGTPRPDPWPGVACSKMRYSPDQLLDVVLLPITFVPVFVFLFGKAVPATAQHYLQFVLPGIAVQALMFASLGTALASVPIRAPASSTGSAACPSPAPPRSPAHLSSATWPGYAFLPGPACSAFGVALGFRAHGGLAAALAARRTDPAVRLRGGLDRGTGRPCSARSARTVQGFSHHDDLPAHLRQQRFCVRPRQLSGLRCRRGCKINPVTQVVDAARDSC